PFLALLPLFAVYALMPLAVLAGRLAGRPEVAQHFGPRGLTLWLALAGLALVVCLGRDLMARKRPLKSAWTGLVLAAAMAGCVFLLLRLLGPVLSQAQSLAPLLDELRLPALVLFAWAWAWSFGAPRREDLARLGGVLGAILLLDFLLTAIMARQLVLGGGFLLGGGQAASDTLAFLLCLALSATLDAPDAAPDAASKARPGNGPAVATLHTLSRWLILAGIFVSFSRGGLAAAALIILFLERGPMQERLALFCAGVLGIWMSLALPLARTLGTPMGMPLGMPLGSGGELSLTWHLTALLEAFRVQPGAWLLGLPLGEPMALAMPDLGGLDWDPEAAGLAVSVFDIPSSWLRLLAGWGAGGPGLALAGMLACALHGRRRFGFGLLLATLVLAALTPALHTPATAGVLALACVCAWGPRPRPAPEARPAPAPDATNTPNTPNTPNAPNTSVAPDAH
ncbi:MAG: hypothetical protein Q8S17_14915, partial [Humidesulfovibrio sp.]|nr:hypothetical protein [Humidesulfovibrio sp.]